MFKNSCIKTGWYMYQLVSQWRVPAILLRTINHWKPIVSTKRINAQTEFQRISESKLAGQHATCFHFHWRYLGFVRVWCAIFTTFFFYYTCNFNIFMCTLSLFLLEKRVERFKSRGTLRGGVCLSERVLWEEIQTLRSCISWKRKRTEKNSA